MNIAKTSSDALLSRKEAAFYLDISEKTLATLASNKSYPAQLTDRRAKYRKSDLESLIADAEKDYPQLLFPGSYKQQVPLISLVAGNNLTYSRVGNWFISSYESVSYDNSCYSKAWHRRHGGRKIVESRTVMIRRMHNECVEARDIKVNDWRGQWLLNALCEADVIAPIKISGHLKTIQLNKFLGVRLIRSINGVSLYERTLVDTHYDYCVAKGKITFHANTISNGLKGLRRKLAISTGVPLAKSRLINVALCQSLGFCDAGIKEFCHDFDLDINAEYSAKRIYQIISADLSLAAKYQEELHKVADSLNYSLSIDWNS